MNQSPHSRRVYFILIFIVICLRVLFASHIWLIDDEAYYWDWTHHLAWSYYDHPGMTAWLIAISQSLLGTTLLGVRLFAILFHLASWFLLWRLALEMFGSAVAVCTAVLFLLIPVFSLGGFLMVPDAPMGFFWLALVFVFWRIYQRAKTQQPTTLLWLAVGALAGLGLNSKFTMVAIIGSAFISLCVIPSLRRQLARPGPWLAFLICALFCFPIVIWNIHHGWPGFRYQFYERQNTQDGIHFGRWLGFLGSQAGFLSPVVWIGVWLTLVECLRRWKDERWQFLFCLSVPTLALFYVQPLFAEFKPHWPAPGYTLLVIGMSALWWNGGFAVRARSRAWATWALGFLVFLNLVVFVPTTYPVIPKVYRLFVHSKPWDYRWDPTNDLYNWDDLGRELHRIEQDEFARTGLQPFLAGERYQLASQVSFATQQPVWKFGPNREQADFVQTKEGIAKLIGHNALIVTTDRYNPNPMNTMKFSKCDERDFTTYRGSEKSRVFHIFDCQNFNGPR